MEKINEIKQILEIMQAYVQGIINLDMYIKKGGKEKLKPNNNK